METRRSQVTIGEGSSTAAKTATLSFSCLKGVSHAQNTRPATQPTNHAVDKYGGSPPAQCFIPSAMYAARNYDDAAFNITSQYCGWRMALSAFWFDGRRGSPGPSPAVTTQRCATIAKDRGNCGEDVGPSNPTGKSPCE